MQRIDVAKALPLFVLLSYQSYNGMMGTFFARSLGSEHPIWSANSKTTTKTTTHHHKEEPQQIIGTIPSCFISIAIAFTVVTLRMFVAHNMKWGEFKIDEDIGDVGTIHEYLMLVPEFFCIVAEELVVRCYLLPLMMMHYTTGQAIALSGCIWSLYTVPMALLLGKGDFESTWSGHRLFLSAILTSYPCSWVAIKAGYVCWGPSLLHFVSKTIGAFALGSMETKEVGIVRGEPWKTNGLSSIIAGVPFALFTTFELNTLSHI
ncbi:uncharacterized protein [Antedon mediterranea]|uniref:uncharacterized protein n=1 Tax=Antedon mediterranea TaxID=105859 RepID=UPI003AF539F0